MGEDGGEGVEVGGWGGWPLKRVANKFLNAVLHNSRGPPYENTPEEKILELQLPFRRSSEGSPAISSRISFCLCLFFVVSFRPSSVTSVLPGCDVEVGHADARQRLIVAFFPSLKPPHFPQTLSLFSFVFFVPASSVLPCAQASTAAAAATAAAVLPLTRSGSRFHFNPVL